jgi:putative NIF3 family GTP cyclohydrolase 1 type 2
MDRLWNPFADTRILYGDMEKEITTVAVGVDMEAAELLVVDKLNSKGKNIDLVIAHHPEGKAYARFYDVMDLQADMFALAGVSISVSENLTKERKWSVARRVHAANHQRSVDIAKLLDLNFMCMHTACDNLAYDYLRKLFDNKKPGTLNEILKLLLNIPEYVCAAKQNNAPVITVGSEQARCKNIHVEFTGGTEGSKDIYKELSRCGIDTIVAMHQSEEHYKMCKEQNINVIVASHIASDNLGINRMLDFMEEKGKKLKVYELAGFRRIKRNK